MDSATTASCRDRYQSSGSNWEVTRVAPRPSRAARILRSSLAASGAMGVVRKSSYVKHKIMRSSSGSCACALLNIRFNFA